MKTALLSVYDKTNLIPLAQALIQADYQILSTGGTFAYLSVHQIPCKEVSTITHFPEILEGRVKTLSPYVFGGILAKRNKPEHIKTLEEMQIASIDMVVVNLYPFFEKRKENLAEEALIEFIDIGGPSMLRAAAKSFYDVLVLSDIADYELVIDKLNKNESIEKDLRRKLAAKVFSLTASYDAAIAQTLSQEEFPHTLVGSFIKSQDLRYGENPHQKASFYRNEASEGAFGDFEVLSGKEISFNNLRDMDTAWKVVHEFEEIACCGVKHATPCGVALGNSVFDAWQKAYDGDPVSIFGGIVAFNRPVDLDTAQAMKSIFLEVILAPDISIEAMELLKTKKNLRLIKMNRKPSDTKEWVNIDGGILLQDTDREFATQLEVITDLHPTDAQRKDLIFAQKVVKHVKSNAIVVASDLQILGVGTGQTNRIQAAHIAIDSAKAKKQDNLVLASDAFFPFRDVVDYAAEKGITAIIQPGGSIKDQESIEAANEHKIPMIFTHKRHFKH
ncbi:MAG: bifunctional phosphoribosylaminoimidazolecarboxamide formyltransferase/IMP cyclohydrolase [Chitinophagales bacterium]|jgi:phosphoribosylaminoimidazolecarboxamide formyltransferase/IMP cyclohydrolase|nr:bifunctional phosphoribosylaminoimidazolecarboxamide formyltransferase/IMP cyclohydrolase [Chitinophagales bacterium]